MCRSLSYLVTDRVVNTSVFIVIFSPCCHFFYFIATCHFVACVACVRKVKIPAVFIRKCQNKNSKTNKKSFLSAFQVVSAKCKQGGNSRQMNCFTCTHTHTCAHTNTFAQAQRIIQWNFRKQQRKGSHNPQEQHNPSPSSLSSDSSSNNYTRHNNQRLNQVYMEGLKRAKAACHRKKYTFPSRC